MHRGYVVGGLGLILCGSMACREPRTLDLALDIPDVRVVDQDGRSLHFYSDLLQGKVVAINFIYTTCTTICPPLGSTFHHLQDLLGEHLGKDFQLISITLDPQHDTPERMKAWGEKFKAREGWTLVTGDRLEINRLLRSLRALPGSKETHGPIVLIGSEALGKWTWAPGLGPRKLAPIISGLLAQLPPPTASAPPAEASPAHRYFTDVELVDQDGVTRRLYRDLLRGKVVIINSFFTTCTSICPPMSNNLRQIQDWLGERLGKEVHLLSLSVDSTRDTPGRLKEYAGRLRARPGWYFLTGKKENVEVALGKLGLAAREPEQHTSIILIGNEPTGLWKKAFGLARAAELIKLVEEVLADGQMKQQKQGRQIYLQGRPASGRELKASLGGDSAEMLATLMPCVNCHGVDGEGRPEGGAVPPEITWKALTRPYEVVSPSGRRHPPYTDRSLLRALTLGVDPAGNPFLNIMPRYRLTHDEAADLLAYLKVLGVGQEPGVTDSRLLLGTVVPARGLPAEVGREAQVLMAAYFARLNAEGGLYGRQIELERIEAQGTAAATLAALERAGGSTGVFALVGGLGGTPEEDIGALAERQGIPLVGPLALPFDNPGGRQAFYLLPRLREQTLAALLESPAPAGEDGELRALVDQHRLSSGHPGMQRWAYAAAKVMTEGLQRAGRRLSRERLIGALEGLRDYRTGVMPAVSFGPGRRVGIEEDELD